MGGGFGYKNRDWCQPGCGADTTWVPKEASPRELVGTQLSFVDNLEIEDTIGRITGTTRVQTLHEMK